MTQRLGLARVLLHDPQVLLLDEPASGLDPRARIEIRGLLKELRKHGQDHHGLQPHPARSWPTSATRSASSNGASCLVNDDVSEVMQQVAPTNGPKNRRHRQRPTARQRLESAARLLEQAASVEKVEPSRNRPPRHAKNRRPRPQSARQATDRQRPRPDAPHRRRNQPRDGVHGAHQGHHVVMRNANAECRMRKGTFLRIQHSAFLIQHSSNPAAVDISPAAAENSAFRPVRLVAQDTALSRRRQGFDSPTGYFSRRRGLAHFREGLPQRKCA